MLIGQFIPTSIVNVALPDTNVEHTIFARSIIKTQGGDLQMAKIRVTRQMFLEDAQGKTFAEVVNDPKQPFEFVLEFFDSADRQRRMEESELHHDRAPLAGVVRELESEPVIDRFLRVAEVRRNTRFRQAIGVLVRIIMERKGWVKTGRKGSLGVRAAGVKQTPAHNTGGLAFWFIRAERYELADGMPYRSVQERCSELSSRNGVPSKKSTASRKNRKKLSS